jgi:hypothetical protein
MECEQRLLQVSKEYISDNGSYWKSEKERERGLFILSLLIRVNPFYHAKEPSQREGNGMNLNIINFLECVPHATSRPSR